MLNAQNKIINKNQEITFIVGHNKKSLNNKNYFSFKTQISMGNGYT